MAGAESVKIRCGGWPLGDHKDVGQGETIECAVSTTVELWIVHGWGGAPG